jgi:hypothetical protein
MGRQSVVQIVTMKRNGRSRKRSAVKKPFVELHVRLYEEHDRTLISFMDHDRKVNERSWQKQVRHMLRQAAGVAQ